MKWDNKERLENALHSLLVDDCVLYLSMIGPAYNLIPEYAREFEFVPPQRVRVMANRITMNLKEIVSNLLDIPSNKLPHFSMLFGYTDSNRGYFNVCGHVGASKISSVHPFTFKIDENESPTTMGAILTGVDFDYGKSTIIKAKSMYEDLFGNSSCAPKSSKVDWRDFVYDTIKPSMTFSEVYDAIED